MLSGVVLAIVLVAAVVGWWRWGRIRTFDGDIPLPPRARLTRVEGPRGAATGVRPVERRRDECVAVGRVERDEAWVREFFDRRLTAAGWVASGAARRPSRGRLRYVDPGDPEVDDDDRILRLALRHRPQQGATNFTLSVRPCHRP